MRSLKNILYIVTVLIAIQLVVSCEKNTIYPESHYVTFDLPDGIDSHPNAARYNKILEQNRRNGLVGAVLLVKDSEGLWIGSDGYSDIASGIKLDPSNRMLIASISKVFTASAVYRYIDRGILSFNDPLDKWIDKDIVKKISNGDKAEIRHLLSHTSGIADYYTLRFELDRINNEANGWSKEEVLKYIYGKKPTNEVGEGNYCYSNTNFLLLSMILEKASGKSFEQIYKEELFSPLSLASAYYSESNPIPYGTPKGYIDIYGNSQFVESEFLYRDELGIGGDGGVVINAYDLYKFFNNLTTGNIISAESFKQMTAWFDVPENQQIETGCFKQIENGFGLMRYETKHGSAIGHSGAVNGFFSHSINFPESDKSVILLMNSGGAENGDKSMDRIINEALDVMFE